MFSTLVWYRVSIVTSPLCYFGTKSSSCVLLTPLIPQTARNLCQVQTHRYPPCLYEISQQNAADVSDRSRMTRSPCLGYLGNR
jgi:hypothetical protein